MQCIEDACETVTSNERKYSPLLTRLYFSLFIQQLSHMGSISALDQAKEHM